ncbi:hypothetical protein [Siphonobacter sp. SORGH_AS_1065]|uniref:hypothetical protein n=1 Tax=Siphonobacter sp. SORGH_AS_1065 TaxID=3041795 RepID=UPI00277E8675|nr:hypothetical protein [Siphonobacter sp. SORGH_AS_1065]MDQ1089526.1 hypothetical protein [Siphonobacter sp. SORGH_AS_1065]
MNFLRSSTILLFISIFTLVSCSKDNKDASNPIKKSDLVNKNWVGNSVDVKVDGNTYSVDGDADASSTGMLLKENGEYVGTDENGDKETGKWTLTDNILKVTVDKEDISFKIVSLDGQTLKLFLGEKLDISKSPETYLELDNENFLAYVLGFAVLEKKKVDLTTVKTKEMDVILGLKAK